MLVVTLLQQSKIMKNPTVSILFRTELQRLQAVEQSHHELLTELDSQTSYWSSPLLQLGEVGHSLKTGTKRLAKNPKGNINRTEILENLEIAEKLHSEVVTHVQELLQKFMPAGLKAKLEAEFDLRFENSID